MNKQRILLIFTTLLIILIAYQNFSVSHDSNDGNTKEAWADTPLSFANYQEMMKYHSQLEVAGYGSSTGGFGAMTSLGQFTFFSAQIPEQQKFRVFVYGREQEPTPYVFVDNFIIAGKYPPVLTFMAAGDELIYIHEITGETIRRKKIALQ